MSDLPAYLVWLTVAVLALPALFALGAAAAACLLDRREGSNHE